MRYCLANLALPPAYMLVGDGDLRDDRLEWTQAPTHYTLFYYHQRNAVILNGQTTAVGDGDLVLVAPGTRAGHAVVGEGQRFEYFTFDLPGRRPAEVALPVHLPDRKALLPELRRASERITVGIEPAAAFVWGLLWSVAQSTSLFREREALYLAEAFVRRNLHRRFTVAEMAEGCRTTHRKLLEAFRQEHGVSIQEFVVRTRVQEAARLLLNTSLPVKEIATKVGYADLQEFNKVVRAGTGASPRRYRDGRS